MAIKILLADDSLTIQKVVELTFSDAETRLMAVGSGDRAVQALDDFQPDIVLADVVMPGLTGYEVCETVKARPGGAFVPVVLLTGTFEPFDRGRAERVGSDAIVTKPFDSHALQGLVRELVAIASAAREEAASAPPPEAPVPAPTLILSSEEMEDAFPPPASPAQDTGATQVLTALDFEDLAQPPFAEAAASAPEEESLYRTVAMKIPTAEEMTLAAENEGLAVPPPQEPEMEFATEPSPPLAFYEPEVANEPPPPPPPAFFEVEPEIATESAPPAFDEPEIAYEPSPPPPPAFYEPEPAYEPPPPPPPPAFYEAEPAYEPPPPPPPPAFFEPEPEIATEPPPPPPAFYEPEIAYEPPPPPPPPAFFEPEPEVATEPPPPPPAFYEPEVAFEPPPPPPPPAFFEPEPEVATEPSEPFLAAADEESERTAPVGPARPEEPAFDLSPEESVVAVEEQAVEPFPEMDDPAPAPEPGQAPWDEEPPVEIPPPPPELAGSPEEGEDAEPVTRDIEADLEAFESSGRVRRRPEIWERHAALIGEEVPDDIDMGEAPPAPEPAPLETAEPFPSELEEIAAAARLEDLSKLIPSTPQAQRPAEKEEVETATPAETTLPVGGGAPLSLTDADIDRIARRVVELLSDKAVRDIAWEVVPEYAERLVRERISEVERAG